MEKLRFRTTNFCNFLDPEQNKMIPLKQFFITFKNEIFLFILYPNSISLIKAKNGESINIPSDKTFSSIASFDQFQQSFCVLLVTQQGEFYTLQNHTNNLDPSQFEFVQEPFLMNATCACIYNGKIIASNKKGIITLKHDSSTWSSNKPENGFLSHIFRPPGIISLSVDSTFVFALTQDGKLLVFDVFNGTKIASTTIYDLDKRDFLKSGKIINNRKICYIMANHNNGAKLIAIHVDDFTNEIIYTISRPFIEDFEINEEVLLLISQNEITIHDLNNGKLISTLWIVTDDITFNCIKNVSRADTIIPKSALLTGNNLIYLATNSSIYLSRPILEYESYVLSLEDKVQSPNLNFLSLTLEFARTIPRQKMIDFDRQLRNTTDVSMIAYELIAQFFDREYKFDFRFKDVIDQIQAIYNEIEIVHHNVTQRTKPKITNQLSIENNITFWKTVVSQIIFSYSYLCKCVYLFLIYLTYKGETAQYFTHLYNFASLVQSYTQLSILAEHSNELPSELFEKLIDDFRKNPDSQFNFSLRTNFKLSEFNSVIRSQMKRMLDVISTSDILIQHQKYDISLEYLKISQEPTVQYGVTLFYLKKYDEAIKYFISNPSFFSEITEFLNTILLKTLQKEKRDDLIVKLCSLSLFSNQAALFRSYLNMKDYDSAFNCILHTEDEHIKCDLLRVFVRTMIRSSQTQKLLSYPFNSMLSIFVNELCCYSIDTLVLAINFFRQIGDQYQAAQYLYLYARTLLRDPSEENLSKALTALNLVSNQMLNSDNQNIIIKDVSSNQAISYRKLWRIICRTKGCLLLDDPKKATDVTFTKLIRIASKKNIDVLASIISGATEDELIEAIPHLIKNQNFLALHKILSRKPQSNNTTLLEHTLTQYFNNRQSPPAFVIQMFTQKNVVKLLMLCNAANQRTILINVLNSLLYKKDKEDISYIVPALRKLDLPEEYIDNFISKK